ncbi:MAG: hypothetical protein ACO3O0_03980 [Bacteroidia bacterium]
MFKTLIFQKLICRFCLVAAFLLCYAHSEGQQLSSIPTEGKCNIKWVKDFKYPGAGTLWKLSYQMLQCKSHDHSNEHQTLISAPNPVLTFHLPDGQTDFEFSLIAISTKQVDEITLNGIEVFININGDQKAVKPIVSQNKLMVSLTDYVGASVSISLRVTDPYQFKEFGILVP